jgi:hypothetical protein
LRLAKVEGVAVAEVEALKNASSREYARYVEGFARAMKAAAAERKLDFLAYLLAMVENEAGDTARRLNEVQR